MPQGKCLLCRKDCELQHSHILPAFVFRWLRETSGTGFLRTQQTPNLRAQDGEKQFWLCSDCEQLFSREEKAFADRLFYPFLSNPSGSFRYAHWLARFCVSVSWRVLQYYLQGNHLADWQKEPLERVNNAESAWRGYLLGTRRRPGEFQQHLLALDEIESSSAELVPHINRYLMRAIQMDVCRGTDSIFTYAKMSRFIVLGFVHEPQAGRWRGSRIDAVQGSIRPRRYELPQALLDYLNEKAQGVSDALGSISERQQDKIDAAFQANIDRAVNSDAFRAMNADAEMFGVEAILRKDRAK